MGTFLGKLRGFSRKLGNSNEGRTSIFQEFRAIFPSTNDCCSQNLKLCLHPSTSAVSTHPPAPSVNHRLQPTFDVLYRDKKPIRILLSLSSSLKQSWYPIADDSLKRNMRRIWLMNVTPNFCPISNYVTFLVFFWYLNVGSHHREGKKYSRWNNDSHWRWIINQISIQNEGKTFIYRRDLSEIQNIFIILQTFSFYSI
jgi:hypothetical protein